MLTIDWKERLTQDTDSYLQEKLPQQDYDFEIIFNAYPERSNGKVPTEVINFISGIIVQRLGKHHAEQIPFYRFLWFKKGDNGKQAFAAILSKLLHKEPELYLNLLEEIFAKAEAEDIGALMDKIMLPLCRKYPEQYLNVIFGWNKRGSEELTAQALKLLTKLVRRNPELIPQVFTHIQSLWSYPLGDLQSLHLALLKNIAKLDEEAYLGAWQEFGISRTPQIVELLCGSIEHYHPEIEAHVELWTKSGNARVKKAGTNAMKALLRKKGAKK
ncbi:MAG: hypothetical protein WCY84_00980 [Candidatus Cloacimonadaceae bacterium]